MDDVLLHSRLEQEHLVHLKEVFAILCRYKFYLKLRKCQFFLQKVTFLGHKIDHSGVHIAIEKVKAVHEWPEPKMESQVRAFLGFVNLFHNSLCYLAQVSEPLTRLTCKDMS